MLKALFVLEIFIFLSWFFVYIEKRLDEKVKVISKNYDVKDWTANNYAWFPPWRWAPLLIFIVIFIFIFIAHFHVVGTIKGSSSNLHHRQWVGGDECQKVLIFISRSFIKRQTRGTSSGNEWQRVVQRMTTSGTASGNEWQRMTTNDNERHQMTKRGTTSKNDTFTSKNGWLQFFL